MPPLPVLLVPSFREPQILRPRAWEWDGDLGSWRGVVLLLDLRGWMKKGTARTLRG